ncbi:hypothetical protein EMPG_17269 [Blastomyces silverae]|uniref:Secreted protein n=1 Tax=Blastomyces silverae TaxID=2060906 RepID=A0A0H1B760_9EURO|nr:hypothetical protein EMPG_17269 [Blastomyces silverae]
MALTPMAMFLQQAIMRAARALPSMVWISAALSMRHRPFASLSMATVSPVSKCVTGHSCPFVAQLRGFMAFPGPSSPASTTTYSTGDIKSTPTSTRPRMT